MAQDHQMIGEVSPQLNRVAAEHQGWKGQDHEPLVAEYVNDWDFSFYARRANMQALGQNFPNTPSPNFVDHRETPVAAIIPEPWS